MTPSKLRWGLLFITVGVMLLLCNTDRLDWDYWLEILTWWPLLLIAIGLEKIFLKTKLQIFSYLSPLLLIGGMIFVAFDVGSDNRVKGFFSSSRWSEPLDPSVKQINAVIKHKNIDLYINRTGNNLASARFDRFSKKPRIDFSKSDGVARLDIGGGRSSLGGTVFISGRRVNRGYRLSFSDDIPLNLKCTGDGAELTLNMQLIPLKHLTIENDEGDIYLRIGDKEPLVIIEVSGDDADFRLKAPEGCGIEVIDDKYESYLSALEFIKIGDNYRTKAFDSAAVKVKLEIPDELRHLSIEFE